MTPPIRMVSVPVELAETPAIRNSLGLFRSAILCGEQWSDTCRDAYMAALKELDQLAMLTAAPVREEGGAVILKGVGKIDGDGWKDTTRKGEVVFVWGIEKPSPYAPGQYPRIGNEGWSASTSQYDFLPATVQEVCDLFAALATREEAPTEAGEDELKAIARIIFPESERVKMDREWGGNRSHSRARWNKAIAQAREIRALRAQPPAREDAQPVGWVSEAALNRLSNPDESEKIYGNRRAANYKDDALAVYTHPAPDALRVAVEALDPFARIASEGVIRADKGHVTVTTCAEYFHAAVKALAALQAEQKGGAA
ncbi:hypothetical protein [uncultured Hyphomicrobium sp.]|uniref:hypothetical protein n=1 Tax=uncultured Hyphomicrobium sp. TaxID=194373 RepID=UPI0025CE4F86|nr:hypothetical protein [uncultured Hyphomicrobium sp.]